jgi:hypothetical protein
VANWYNAGVYYRYLTNISRAPLGYRAGDFSGAANAYLTQMASPTTPILVETTSPYLETIPPFWTTCPQSSDTTGLSSGVIIGISVGVFAAVLIVVFFVVRYLRSRARRYRYRISGESAIENTWSDKVTGFKLAGQERHEMGDERVYDSQAAPIGKLENLRSMATRQQDPITELESSLSVVELDPDPRTTSLVAKMAGQADIATKAKLSRTGSPSALPELAVTERPVNPGVALAPTELPAANFPSTQLAELSGDSVWQGHGSASIAAAIAD